MDERNITQFMRERLRLKDDKEMFVRSIDAPVKIEITFEQQDKHNPNGHEAPNQGRLINDNSSKLYQCLNFH